MRRGVPGARLQGGRLGSEETTAGSRSTRHAGAGSYARELEVACRLALRAGDVMRRHRAEGLRHRQKASGELVTAADLECDALIRGGLVEAFPDDALLSEETSDGPARLSARRVWIVDPIDGTRDFASGGDEHVCSIGLSEAGRAVLGVLYNPARDELFAGAVGHGVQLGGEPVGVTDVTDLREASLTVSRNEWRHGLLRPQHRVRAVASVAYKLARVAAGLDDGTFSDRPRREWDVCGGVALVRAAGGRVGLLDARVLRFNRREVMLSSGLVAAGPGLYPALLQAVRSAVPETVAPSGT